jgi:hypothetical protein
MQKIAATIIAVTIALTSGCSLLGSLPVVGPILGGGGEPALAGEEQTMLYARGLREVMPDPLKELKIAPTERVWVINKNGGTNTDRPIDAVTYDAIVDVLRSAGISEAVARDDDMLRSLYVEYTESGKLAARADSLARDGKIQPADVMLAYRVLRLNTRNPGFIILGIRFVVAGILGLFTDAQPNLSDGLRIGIHLDVIDVKTGTIRTSTIVERVEPQPNWFVADYLFDGIGDGRGKKSR